MNTFCSKDCPDLCALKAQITNGKLKTEGKKESWQSTGFVCAKFKLFAEREIGNSVRSYRMNCAQKEEFTSETDALNAAADMLQQYRDKKILYVKGSGSLAYNMGYWDVLMSGFENCYKVTGGVCDNTGGDAHEADFGTELNPPVENIQSADTIILFGKNAAVISQHLYSHLKDLKKLDKKIIYIDPVRTKTAAIADRYIRINPGCDGLLAYALLCSLGYEKSENAQRYLELSGINNDDFQYLFSSISGKTAFIEGFGIQRQTNGMNAVRLINRLAVKTGNTDRLYYGHGSKRFWESLPAKFNNFVHINEAAEKLASGEFDLFINVAANPAMTYPDAKNWVKGINSTPTIVVDTCHTRTSENCDLFLKVGGMFAQKDFMASYFFEHFHVRESLTDELSDMDAAKYIADRLNIPLEFAPPKAKTLAKRAYKDEPIEPVIPETSDRFQLFSASHHLYLNSQHTPEIADRLKTVMINPKDAEKLGVKNGDELTVENEYGYFKADAAITDDVPEKLILCWKNIPMKEGFINDMIPPRLTDSGNGMVYYTVFADVRKS